ncbi:aminotransferase class V-fold PLP-dependent enzyme [Clostridiaceae bacterium NSJ-31]|uniref:cysteine desulfurase n=2 Tax=Ligaoa zhengdingensis TaxID=2763658 RepID=A0A926DU46_9FIRM|nr:aminotransferase class V-fold PLP-dependent enzyme [Ligaoa zhengdingensis]MBC8545320.1 aminotransferase class V-fold PLP-dependent enzyme [Ligaoa zhengdingensis]
MIYFDNAATTYPKPPQLIGAFSDYLKMYGANPGRSGHEMSLATAKQVYETRELIGSLFHAENPEAILFTQNCTHSLNLVLKGVLKWGDHVVISALEHNSVLRPVYQLWREHGVQYSVAQVVEGDDDATVENFRRCLHRNTRLIACTHGSNVFGIKLPIERLARLAHENNALFLADCAQTAGVEEIDFQAMGLDFLAAPGHKGLYGPTGTGVLLLRDSEFPLDTLMEGGTGSNSLDYAQPDFLPDRLESGTVNTAGILALRAGVAEVINRSTARIKAHEMALAQALYDGLTEIPGVRLYTARPTEQHHLPVISFTVEGEHSETTAQKLNQYGAATRGGYHCAPLPHQKMGTLQTGTVRASLGMYNTEEEVREFLTILKMLQNQKRKD